MNESATALLRELDEICESELLSEEGLREIIERHGLTPNNNSIIRDNTEIFFRACYNERSNDGIIRLLLEYFPTAASATDENGMTPLHHACHNKNMTRGIIKLLTDAAPASVRVADNFDLMPLHLLCGNDSMNETAAVEILQLLIEKYPNAVRHADNDGYLPIHIAARWSNHLECCRVLIEAYPGSERIGDAKGRLPLHVACRYSNTLSTIEFFYKLHPDAINHASTDGLYPIHYAMRRITNRNIAAETVQFLLECDPIVKFQKFRGITLLCAACLETGHQEFNDSCIDTALEIIKAFYDAHPEAIEDNQIAFGIQDWHEQAQAFINSELVYARQARDHRLMMTADDNGRLPLHTALQDNVRLGSIKLLVKGNPSAIRNFDDSGAIPLHVACEHHEPASVVGHIVSLAGITLDTIDRKGNTALHYACRGATYDTIALLLDKFDAISVSKRNVDGKLPIDLLWESNGDRESVAYTESVYRLLRAYPETTMRIGLQAQSDSASCPRPNPKPTGKKRKLGDD